MNAVWPIGLEKVDFDEAIAWFLSRTPIPKAEWEALEVAARKRAFTVAGVAQLDVIDDVWRAVDKAVAEGTTLEDFKADVGAKLKAAWQGSVKDPAWRMETIFRTNVQTAYAAGRHLQLTDPDTLDDRPYWLFDAVMDDRTTKVCRACDGTILPADDPWWSTHSPPLHFNCRSTIISLTGAQARERGVAVAAPDASPDKGFGAPPGKDDWEPDPAKYEPELWRTVEPKLAPPANPAHDPKHWEAEYARFGAAAKTLAYARAAEHRGLDLPVADAEKALDGLRHPAVARALTLVDIARAEGHKVETLRDIIPFAARTKGPEGAQESVRVAAAFAAHLGDVSAIGKLPCKATFPTADPAKKRAKHAWDVAEAFLGKMLDKKVSLGGVTVGFGVERGYFRASTNAIGVSDDAHVLEHELGHALEHANPVLAERAEKFLAVRTGREKPRPLRDLTGNSAYEAREVARPDAFRNPYVGKVYERDGVVTATEVTSMGIEWLASYESASTLKEDPEHFYFALGQLAGVGL